MLPEPYLKALLDEPDLRDDDKVHMAALTLAHRQHGPLAAKLLATPPDAVELRREMLQRSWAWRAAERDLERE